MADSNALPAPSFANQGARRLRTLLASNKTICLPGVFDGLGARLALAAGFDCLYMTGAGTSLSRLGMADLGLATHTDMVAAATALAAIDPRVPLVADADTGYGGPNMVRRTLHAYARAGVAGLHIEDQVQEKRCGHLLGKQLVPREVWYARLRAAVQAREEIESEIVLIARTDARAGEGFDEAVERLRGAVDAGADVLFLEALQNKDEARRACELLGRGEKGRPMLLNMVPGGVTPTMGVAEAQKLGFSMVIFPTVMIEAVIQQGTRSLRHLKETGEMQEGAEGVRRAFELCGLRELMAIDEKAGGIAYGTV